MRILLLLLALVAPFAHAATATFTGASPCYYDVIVISANGDALVTCTKSAPVPPVPPPVPGTCPVVPGLVMHDTFGLAGSPMIFATEQGVLHAFPLPKAAAGVIVSTATTTTPGTLELEWTISKCPGDTAYYKTPAAAFTGRGGVVYHPCGAQTGWESGGVKWNIPGGTQQCKVPAGETWYVNLRYTAGCTGTCSIYRAWQVN